MSALPYCQFQSAGENEHHIIIIIIIIAVAPLAHGGRWTIGGHVGPCQIILLYDGYARLLLVNVLICSSSKFAELWTIP